jgi:hypothetical protein
VKRTGVLCSVAQLAMFMLTAGLALQFGGLCWAGPMLANLPFDQAVKQLIAFEMDSSSAATTALPPAPLAEPKTDFGWDGPVVTATSTLSRWIS